MSLTSHAKGSFRELWTISYPLMIAHFCWILMFFVDRLFLSSYSQAAFNAAVNASMLSWTFLEGFNFIASMAEIFVAQYNGAKKNSMVAAPVWQMIWFALLSALFLIPLGIWGSRAVYELFYGSLTDTSLEQSYFEWIMLFGFMFPLGAALSAFFLGRGKTKLMIWIALATNIVNIILDWILIFGVPDWLPPQGVRGAAIATGLSQTCYTGALLYFFLHKKEQKEFQTRIPVWSLSLFKKCIQVGGTFAFSYTLELIGISIFYMLMGKISTDHMTISGVCQTALIFLSFFGESIMKGVIAITGNLIGAKEQQWIPRVLRTSLYCYLAFCACMAIPLLVYPRSIVDLFLNSQHWINDVALSADSALSLEQIKDLLVVCLRFVYFYLVFKGLGWPIYGVLIAAGDSIFLATVGPVLVWVAFLLPIYYFVYLPKAYVDTAWMISMIYSIILLCCYALRLWQGKWKKISLIT